MFSRNTKISLIFLNNTLCIFSICLTDLDLQKTRYKRQFTRFKCKSLFPISSRRENTGKLSHQKDLTKMLQLKMLSNGYIFINLIVQINLCFLLNNFSLILFNFLILIFLFNFYFCLILFNSSLLNKCI